jgi:hypothetical protein
VKEINLYAWFGQRELDYCPKHFVKANTPLTQERRLWILEKLQGRFYCQQIKNIDLRTLLDDIVEMSVPYFEDPQEAILYELTWS